MLETEVGLLLVKQETKPVLSEKSGVVWGGDSWAPLKGCSTGLAAEEAGLATWLVAA